MTDPATFTLHRGGADGSLDERLDAGLTEFNRAATPGVPDAEEFTVAVKDADGELAAGVSGWTWGTAAGIGMTWVRDDVRRDGWGGRLLDEAEQVARDRGCVQMLVSSFTFQAPGFYESRGYVEFARTEGIPTAGSADVHFRKSLD
ncbi:MULTISPECIES: GNAT family N-acetyltransferase [unclassified Nocardioides]|uniref:GNAT family N-acetyltransferase n=1 Tax=unclassified Nocardioides TaxID=2615069 RepID=UPI0006F507AF|nr:MULTISPECIES: GNAT family N-acetyltransferase [unclassified Nocardioides]KQY51613.1 streptothricin acetyltransferase [Nocardioides sp. Root140]KRF10985.1 streptothricin acetyltransferase [Nocardioides sp. Soil796]